MKKELFILSIVTLISIASIAQNENSSNPIDSLKEYVSKAEIEKHFTFLDIPINGSIKEFVKQLKKQNFKLDDLTKVDAILTGRFTGELVQLLVQGTEETVGSVSVIFPERDLWKDAKSKYNYVKSNLIEKYGQPKVVTEKFDAPYFDGSGNEKQALKEGQCVYEATFSTNTGNGMIRIQIHSDMSVMLVYVDTINYRLLREAAKKQY